MPRLALYTFGVLKSPLADPAPHAFTFHHSFTPEGTPTRIEGIGPKSDQVG